MKMKNLYLLEQNVLPYNVEKNTLSEILDKILSIYTRLCYFLATKTRERGDFVVTNGVLKRKFSPEKIYAYYLSRKPCMPAALSIYDRFVQRLETYHRGLRLEEIVKSRLTTRIAKSIRLIETTENIWLKYNFKNAKILDGTSMTGKAMQAFCRKKGIPVRPILPFSLVLDFFFNQLERRILKLKMWTNFSRLKPQVKEEKIFHSYEDNSPRILLLAFHVNHLNLIERLVERFPSRLKGILLVHEYLRSVKREQVDRISKKIRVKTLESYVSEDTLRIFRKMRHMQEKTLPTIVSQCSDVFVYNGISLWSMVQNYFFQLVKEDYPAIIASIELVNTILDKEKPDLILGVVAHRCIERIFFMFAREKGIPTLAVFHAALDPDAAHPGFQLAENIACHGPKVKEMLEKMGVKTSKIRVVGNPLWDRIYYLLCNVDKSKIRDALFQKFSLDPKLKLLVFTTQPKENVMSYITFLLKDVLEHLLDFALIIKVHPAENVAFYNKLLNDFKEQDRVRVLKSVDIHELLLASDIVLTLKSTTGFEAMMLEKPVVIINLKEGHTTFPYTPHEATLHVHDLESLTQALKKLAYDQQMRKRLVNASKEVVYGLAYKQDGLATNRVIQLIKEIIGPSHACISNTRHIIYRKADFVW